MLIYKYSNCVDFFNRYRKADADLNLSRAEVEKQRVNSTIKSQQCDDSKNEYANQLQKTNQAQVYISQSLDDYKTYC